MFNQFLNKDGLQYSNETMHLDNKDKTQVYSIIDLAGGSLNLDDHTIGDFYSHSNYVDLWEDYKPNDSIIKGEMPLMSELDKNPGFEKVVKEQLRTTAYPDEKDRSYTHSKNSKDTDSHHLYSLALKAYQKELRKKYKKNKEDENRDDENN